MASPRFSQMLLPVTARTKDMMFNDLKHNIISTHRPLNLGEVEDSVDDLRRKQDEEKASVTHIKHTFMSLFEILSIGK